MLSEMKLSKKRDINKIEECLLFNHSFFTTKKTKLSKVEKIWFKNKSWNFI